MRILKHEANGGQAVLDSNRIYSNYLDRGTQTNFYCRFKVDTWVNSLRGGDKSIENFTKRYRKNSSMQGQQNMSLKLVMNITLKLQVKEPLDSLAWKFAKLNQLCTIDRYE